jgi:hypothetical protein
MQNGFPPLRNEANGKDRKEKRITLDGEEL